MNKTYDIIIIGGGAAGFAAGIYAGRRGLKTLIISKDIGGQAALTCEIENYPAVGLVEGPDLMQEFKKDAEKFGAEFIIGEVQNLVKRESENDFVITTDQGEFTASAVILAFGLTPRDLGITGEQEFKNKGVYYTALLNPEEFKAKKVTVIGGGSSALISAITLAPQAEVVNIVHRRNEFRGEDVLLQRLEEFKNIKLHLEKIPQEIKGKNQVEELIIADVNDEAKTDSIITDAVFVNAGFIAQAQWLGDLVDYSKINHIVVDRNCSTKTAGLFAAGDVTDLSYKQVVISAGDGAKAAITAYEYLKKEKGFKGSSIDWGIV